MSAVREKNLAPEPIVSRHVQADGLNWHIVEAGQGPVVLLVHGTAASHHSWRDVIPFLAIDHHVIAVDLPGHGGTLHRSSADLRLQRMGQGVSALLKVLNVVPDIVAGHSAGAAVLAWTASHDWSQLSRYVSFNGAFYPFGGVAGSLFSPIAKLVAFNPFVPRLLSKVASRATVEKLLRDTGSSISAEGVDLYFQLFKQERHVAAALGMMAAWDLRGMDDNLPRIKADCIFVSAKGDLAVPPDTADRAAGRCRKGKVLHIDGFGHLLHEENAALAAEIIRGRNA
jgi:magnesium chelatase accessory protein